jgi:xanthine/uracil permease
MAGLVYVVIALAVKFFGVSWISKLMPPVVIGPTVAIIGLSLAGNAVKDAVGEIVERAFFSLLTDLRFDARGFWTGVSRCCTRVSRCPNRVSSR